MRSVRVKFINLKGTMAVETSLVYGALCELCDVELVDNNPDILFYGDNYTEDHRKYSCIKVYIPIENKMPNFRYCDYAISYLGLPDFRNIRLPLYAQNTKMEALMKDEEDAKSILAEKTRFCAFIVSNENVKRSPERFEFFKRLSEYKQVDSGGRVMNNIGYTVGDKLEFLKKYKFTIAFENRAWPGYTSEKIVDPMIARSMPIYWGNPDIGKDFSEESFINVNACKSMDEAIERVIQLDQDDDAYLEVMRKPYLNEEGRKWFDTERMKDFLKRVLDSNERQRSIFYFKDWAFNLQKSLEVRLPFLKEYSLK